MPTGKLSLRLVEQLSRVSPLCLDATATYNCVGTVTGTTNDPITYNAQSTYTVHWTYNDGHGNTSTQNQTVVVDDVTKPTITCPGNINHTADPGVCSYTVNPGTATATDNSTANPAITGTRSDNMALNSPYPVGTTTINWTADDGNGNTQSCTQMVTVTDDEKPAITCPPNVSQCDDKMGTMALKIFILPNTCRYFLSLRKIPKMRDFLPVASELL